MKKNEKQDKLDNSKSLVKAKNESFMSYFGIKKFNTTLAKEIIAGFSTFLAIVYILSIEPNMISQTKSNVTGSNISIGPVFLATAIIIILSSLIMGLVANVPLVLAPGMGVNAVFVFQIANGSGNRGGIGFEGACIATIISGILLLIISTSKLRILIVQSIPKSMKMAITVGIGFMITYIGFKNMGMFEMSGSLPIASLGDFKSNWPSILTGLITLFACLIMYYRKIVGSTAIAMFTVSIIVILLANILNTGVIADNFSSSKINSWSYSEFNGFDKNIKNIFTEFGNINNWNKPVMYESILMLLILTFFDSSSTIDSACNLVYKNREYDVDNKVLVKAMIVDSSSVILAGAIGLSSNTVVAESFVGINQKSKTGIGAITVAILTIIAIPLFPIFKLIPSSVTGGALAFVGILIAYECKEIEWNLPEFQISASLSILITIVTINITNGVGMGVIGYCISCLALKKSKQINKLMWGLFILFIIYFVLYTIK